MTNSRNLDGVVVCSTVAAWKCDGVEEFSWLTHADAWRQAGAGFVLAAEVGQGHDDKVRPLVERVRELGGTVWAFSLDTGEDEVTSHNRLDHIVTGRNLATRCALRDGAAWLVYLDTDIIPPANGIDLLLEMDWPVCGGNVPSYGRGGPAVEDYPFRVEEHWNTAGFLLVRADVADRVSWRYSVADGMSDDPAFDHDMRKLGWSTRVRKDMPPALHPPLFSVEGRKADRGVKHDLRPVLEWGVRSARPPVVIVMPVRGRLEFTEHIVGDLVRQRDDWDRLLIHDNDLSADPGLKAFIAEVVDHHGLPADTIEVVESPDCGIYEMWNRGWRQALELIDEEGPVDVAFLNNDIQVPDHFVRTMSNALRGPDTDDVWAVYPDGSVPAEWSKPTGKITRTHGTKRHGGLLGHAFMLKGEAATIGALPMFNTDYRWWCGDDEMIAEIEARGYTAARVDGLGCDHANEGTAVDHDWTDEAKVVDMRLLNQRWPGY